MDIQTDTIRRLRDALLDSNQSAVAPRSETPEAYRLAVLERFTPFAETMYLMMIIDGNADSAELWC